MFADLHARMSDGGYPTAALLASEGGIYGRFGYGPATVEQTLCVERRSAHFHPDVPDPGKVRFVEPERCRDELEAIYEAWRLRTPGGLYTPPATWDEVLADREIGRCGGSALFCPLHSDGFALYRVHGGDANSVRLTKLVALTGDAHAALWRALLGLDLMDSVTVESRPADPLPYLLTNPRLVRTTNIEDALWRRISYGRTRIFRRRCPVDTASCGCCSSLS